jgi:predicted DNA-binding ribbon-helix-helix protein
MNSLNAQKVSLTGNSRSEDTAVEVPVLLESHLWKRLEATAREQGMTTGALVRCLLRDFLCYSERVVSVRTPSRDSRTAFLC